MKKLTREEMRELIAKLQAGEGNEREAGHWLDQLAASLGNPHISNLIFHSNEDLTPEQIIDRALQYRPFLMPPPSPES